MDTIWQPALLVALAIVLIIFGPSRLAGALAVLRDSTRRVLARLRAARAAADESLHSRRP